MNHAGFNVSVPFYHHHGLPPHFHFLDGVVLRFDLNQDARGPLIS